MPITLSQMLGSLKSGAEGSNPYAEGSEARKTLAQKGAQDQALEKYLKGSLGADGKYQPGVESASASDQANQEVARTVGAVKQLQDIAPEGAGTKYKEAGITPDPYAKLMAQAPKEAETFRKNAQGAYKGINDQLDAAKSTIDSLDQKNSSSDKLALISEAKLAAGSGGSRAIKSIMDSLSGGKTSGMQYQEAVNWLQNTPNVPTMQDAQRDAIRESVFNRMPQVEQQHNQAQTGLMQQGAVTAPHADYKSLVDSYASPASQKLAQLKQMQQTYQSARQKMAPQNPVSNPSQADPNPSTLDKLMSFFKGGAKPAAPPQDPNAAPPGMSLEQFKAWKAKKQAAPQGGPGQ